MSNRLRYEYDEFSISEEELQLWIELGLITGEPIGDSELDSLRSRPFRIHDYTNDSNLDSAIDEIIQILAKECGAFANLRRNSKTYDKTKGIISKLIMDLHLVHLDPHMDNISIHRNQNSFNKGRVYELINMPYRSFVEILNYMIEAKLIMQKLGYSGSAKGDMTRLRAGERLIELLIKHSVDSTKYTRIVPPIKLKNKDGGYEKVDYSKVGNIAKNIELLRAHIAKFDITLPLSSADWSNLLNKYDYFDIAQTDYYRVFNRGSFKKGGRFYGHWSQRIGEEFRKHITIDGKKVTEIDFKSMHPQMLYIKQTGAIYADQDVYMIDKSYSKEDRKLAKIVFNIMINADSEPATLGAVCKKFEMTGRNQSDDRKAEIKEFRERVSKLIYQIINKHSAISMYIHKDIGIKLMYEDSRIAERVMLSMMKKYSAPCLIIHDSFITFAELRDELYQEMLSASAAILGKALPCDIKY